LDARVFMCAYDDAFLCFMNHNSSIMNIVPASECFFLCF